ncbi:cation:proton antiporter [Paenibacillus alginolyticus]|uniref:Cation:proton antiporter n=1 Tax=Paenibacillus alginolyticus TaxID=59839 RepID=A0ABT4GAV9_9BACL|nr:cation:proton antiporter [Paenibacillus alginolyticus]MCY9665149.1 cation:proton antiporter [Paenibacillus alginolyticus]MCY9693264.1 cation:proton antiporter [Paenibacillus alginolyticus]MEC0145038.1 cation:proton antiporter [Paenibacillus alginolyticus]
MENTTSLLIEHVIILLVLIFGLGMISGKVAQWLKLPDVALFLIAGMLVGQAFHWITESSTSFTNQFILVIGSTLILFDGGRNIRLSGLRKVWLTVSLLSVPGVLITCGAVAVAAHLLLDLPWIYALLLGAIIASTDPATLIPVFKQVKIRPKVRETVESESAFNDATASILTFSLLAIILGTQEVSVASGVFDFVKTALGGLLVGAVIGYVMTFLTAHLKLGHLRDYATIAMVSTSLCAYIVGEAIGVSGFMATFTAGLIWGNAGTFKLEMNDKQLEMEHFSENITVIMRMLIFILLGSQVNFPLILEHFWTSLGVIFVFMFIARPLTVLLCTWPDRKAKWKRNEILFMFWVRETGVIPAALSGMVAGMGVQHSDLIASVTFMAVLITILFQASTTAYVARKLGLEIKPNDPDNND